MSNKKERIPHEYLESADFYETISIGGGRSDYDCEECWRTIRKGKGHDHHKFYPDFEGYRTHEKCSDKFLESLRTEEDPEREEDE
jgi:hypothetical protein